MIRTLFLFPYLMSVLFLYWGSAEAFVPQAAYWKNRKILSLKYTTAPQSLYSDLCSGQVTVKTYTANVLTNVTSNLIINLAGNGATTFYSDSNCTTPITTVTITTGTNSASYYFSTSTAGAFNLISSATGYQNASQSETITANPFIWTGGGGNALWSTAGNWSGGSAPGASNIAVFNSSCSSNCSPTISGNLSIDGVRMDTGYSGTITQSPGVTIAIASNWVQKGGNFVGGNSSFTINNKLHIGSGSFTFPASTFQIGSDVTISNSATIVTTNSTLLLTCAYGLTCTINTGSASLNHVSFQGFYTNYSLANNTMTVTGNLSMGDNYGATELDQLINSGTINVTGNITVINNGFKGNAQIVVTGNPSGQIITGLAGRYMPSLKIAAGANPVTITGPLNISNGYSFVSAGSMNLGSSSMTVHCPYNLTCLLEPGSITYNDFSLIGYYGNYNLAGGTLKVGGLFSLGDTYGPGYNGQKINNGTIMAYGNVSVINYGYQGTASVVVAGNPAGQTITGNGTNFLLPNLTISAGTNPVTFSGVISTAPAFTMNSVGTFTTTGSTLVINCDYNITCSINPGTVTYNNVSILGFYSSHTLNGNTMNVAGDLSLGDTFSSGYLNQPINSGTINVAGNVNVINNGNTGSATVVLTGNPSGQTITGANTRYMPNLQVSTGANPVSIAAGLRVYGNMSIASGTVNMAGNNLTVTSALSLASGTTLNKSGGVLSYGSLSNSGTINP